MNSTDESTDLMLVGSGSMAVIVRTSAAVPRLIVDAGDKAGVAASSSPIDVDEGKMQIRYYGRPLELSRYEFHLLKTLAARPGHVYSRDALLERIWGNDTESMDRTVDAHIKTLRAKMKVIAPREDPVRTHRGSGYALAEDLPPKPS